MSRKPLALAAGLALAVLAPSAHAALVPGQVIDGPSTDVKQFGDISIAPDGSGALVYTKAVGGNDNVWVSIFNGGTWSTPQRVSNDTTCPNSFTCEFPHVAAANGGRVLITWVSNQVAGQGNLEAALKPDGSGSFQLADAAPGSDGVVVGDDVDMDPASGVAYAVMDTVGGRVRATRLSGTSWTEVGGAGVNLDNPAGDDAGNTASGEQGTARIAVDSSGNAVAAWPAIDTTAKAQVYARRLVGTTTPDASVRMSVPTFGGANADGLNVDMVNIDGGASSDPWIVFREQFSYTSGRPRDLAVQLVGDTAGPPQALDGLSNTNPPEGAEYPQIDVNPSGQGVAAMPRQLSFQAFGSTLAGGTWATGFRLDTATPSLAPFPTAAIDNIGDSVLAWFNSSDPSHPISARTEIGGVLGAPVTISKAGAGDLASASDAPIRASSSAAGAVAIGFGQNNGGSRTILAAVVDLPQPTGPGGGGGGGGGGGSAKRPVVSRIHLSRTVFALGRLLPRISRKTPVGTTISFSVSQASTTSLSFARAVAGRRAGRRCLAPGRAKRKARRCTRFVSSGSLSYKTTAGPHSLRFQGRLNRNKRLKPGRYLLTIVSRNGAGSSSPQRTGFTLKK